MTASDSPKSPASSVHQCVRRRPAAASSSATPSGRNLHDTSVSISSPAAKSTVRSSAVDPHLLRTACAQPHLDALLVGVPPGDVLERVEVEVGVEFAVHHGEHVLVELRGHARGVVVGPHQAVGVLDQVGAEQQGVTRLQAVGQRGEELGARPGGEVADGRAEERRPAAVPTCGILPRCSSKSPQTASISTPGYSSPMAAPADSSIARVDVERDEPAQRSAGRAGRRAACGSSPTCRCRARPGCPHPTPRRCRRRGRAGSRASARVG